MSSNRTVKDEDILDEFASLHQAMATGFDRLHLEMIAGFTEVRAEMRRVSPTCGTRRLSLSIVFCAGSIRWMNGSTGDYCR